MANIIMGMRSRSRQESRYTNAIESKESEIRSKRKPYTASKWSREMTSQINKDTSSDGSYRPSGSFMKQLDKRGALKGVPNHAKQDLKDKGFQV